MKILERLHFFLWTNPTANNCNTILIDGEKRILIDPGHFHLFAHVRDNLSSLGISPGDVDVVVITHAHPDHMEAVRAFAHSDTLIAMHADEWEFVRAVSRHYGESFGITEFTPHILLREGDLNVEDVNLRVIHAPGHSPGSVCLYWPEQKALITGDVVFDRGVGRTDLPGGNGKQLKDSIQRLARLDVTYLLPGHGNAVSGNDQVRANFKVIQEYWFAQL